MGMALKREEFHAGGGRSSKTPWRVKNPSFRAFRIPCWLIGASDCPCCWLFTRLHFKRESFHVNAGESEYFISGNW